MTRAQFAICARNLWFVGYAIALTIAAWIKAPMSDWHDTWMQDAACKDIGTEMFFPDPNEHVRLWQAIKVCRGCPVRSQCLDYALTNDIRCGVYGGLGQTERMRLRRGQR